MRNNHQNRRDPLPHHRESKINITSFTPDLFQEKRYVPIEEFSFDREQVTWVEVIGAPQSEVIEKVGAQIGLHPLAIEDLMNVPSRPKVDDYEEGIFITMRLLDYDGTTQAIIDEQISLYLQRNLVVAFYEKPTLIFTALKERLRTKKGPIRNQGADFLTYAIIDTVVDNYFIALHKIGAVIDYLEGSFTTANVTKHLKDLHDVQRQIISLRKSIWPVREVIDHLLREEPDGSLLSPLTRFYLQDVHDHAIQAIETLDLSRDLARGLLELTISSMSHRMNEIIKTLTIVSTIFVPLTFITSLYGMNFSHMPELQSRFGYAFVWAVMIGLALFMLRYFRKKRWI